MLSCAHSLRCSFGLTLTCTLFGRYLNLTTEISGLYDNAKKEHQEGIQVLVGPIGLGIRWARRCVVESQRYLGPIHVFRVVGIACLRLHESVNLYDTSPISLYGLVGGCATAIRWNELTLNALCTIRGLDGRI